MTPEEQKFWDNVFIRTSSSYIASGRGYTNELVKDAKSIGIEIADLALAERRERLK